MRGGTLNQSRAGVYCRRVHSRVVAMNIITGKAVREFSAADLARIRR
jgi:hypothetical protein